MPPTATHRTGNPAAAPPGAASGTAHDRAFLDAMSALASGVCVVTTLAPDGTPAGFTSTAVMSLSRTPRLLAIAVDRGSRTLRALLAGRKFALNVLHATGEEISRRFADPAADRFAGLAWTPDEEGLPLLTAHSTHILACDLAEELPAGDHLLLIGAVRRALPCARDGGALVHLGRHYHPLGAGAAA
ncbi:flavin reductase family protein [Streptomyces hoynatensis]|uniref:Flavin reductase n=1 Tax=Streptomyces hoynatensis TaxID=1141874 RepID=A0A3A9YKE0_9ACTN|nr:flavin reductase family protein [Streptomyces hoynatensis]RKN36983.1 flavin reductase [Streptomyces hoynatensis]